MSIKIGPDNPSRPWTPSEIEDHELHRSTLDGLALYYHDMHWFYNEAADVIFVVGGKDVAVSEVEYLEGKALYYLEKYRAEIQ
jgi:hypothetical protein